MSFAQPEPIRVEITRGSEIESIHSVDAVVADIEGVQSQWGRANRSVLPRSALKYVQALPLVASGAAAAFDVDDIEIALACASHSAEQAQIQRIRAWLSRLGLGEEHLECGGDLPLDTNVRQRWLSGGGEALPIVNCCSGKHAGFLTIARHLGVDPAGYVQPDHPVQQLVTEYVGDICGVDLSNQRPGQDGCGIPTWAVPLDAMAAAMAGFTTGGGRLGDFGPAVARVVEAAVGNMYWVSGTDRCEKWLEDHSQEPILAKTGAEGVFVIALVERGLGVAVKARDGATRAAEAAVGAILDHLGVIEAPVKPVLTRAGLTAGEIRVVLERPDGLGE